MKIRYEQIETIQPTRSGMDYGVQQSKRGLIVLETPPHYRTLYIQSQFKNTLRVPLPYIIYVIEYDILQTGFSYGGLYKRGLAVYFSNKSLTSFSDKVYPTPIDRLPYSNSVCTPHEFDGTRFSSVRLLVTTVVSWWYGLAHMVHIPAGFTSEWAKMSLEESLNCEWETKPVTLDRALQCSRLVEYFRPFVIPDDAVLVEREL